MAIIFHLIDMVVIIIQLSLLQIISIVFMDNPFTNILDNHFNLHPLDLIQHSQNIISSLTLFTNSFKDRIELELDYSKSLVKISKALEKNIKPNQPSPLSYIASAFKVQHQQRARHAIELAQYLHTQIEAPCQLLLDQNQSQLKQIQKQIKAYYKEGQSVEEEYQKSLKKFYKSRQQWQQKIIEKSILIYSPGTTKTQKDKLSLRLDDQKRQNEQIYSKYLKSLQLFNSFASRYNNEIGGIIKIIQVKIIESLNVQTNSIRKLIVSEISMFKNIQYDLINISKQMENVNPSQQISLMVEHFKNVFKSPIISIYSEGPILENRYASIDFKKPMVQSYLSDTLSKMQDGVFQNILQNKNNSTMRYCVQNLLLRYEGKADSMDNQFLIDFQESIRMNKIISKLPIDKTQRHKQKRFLDPEEAYSVCLQVVSITGQYLQPYQLTRQKQEERIQLIRTYLNIHHFYRFIVLITLEQYDSIFQGKINNRISISHYAQILNLLLQQSFKRNDVFVVRHVINIMFKTVYIEEGKQHYFYQQQSLYTLDYWDNKSLWDAVIFEACYQLINLLPITQKLELKEIYMMKQKNVIFSGLLSYCHYMIMLGLQTIDVRAIIGRFSQIYNLYQQHQKDLARTISNSSNHYKKLNRIS